MTEETPTNSAFLRELYLSAIAGAMANPERSRHYPDVLAREAMDLALAAYAEYQKRQF